MNTRRSFLKSLAAIPFLGAMLPQSVAPAIGVDLGAGESLTAVCVMKASEASPDMIWLIQQRNREALADMAAKLEEQLWGPK